MRAKVSPGGLRAQRFSAAVTLHKRRRAGHNCDVPEEKDNSGNSNEGHRQRLRERFERGGFGAFAEHEVLELLLTLCIPRRDVKLPAKKLLAKFGSLRGVMDASPEKLREVEGIGTVAPVALRIIRDAAALYLQQGLEQRELLFSVSQISQFLRLRFAGETSECAEVLYLDSGRRLLPSGAERMEKGIVDQVVMMPRKIVESALRRGAKFLIMVHNHPGGSPHFSRADIEVTQAVRGAALAVGMELSDHFLVAGDKVVSMAASGIMDEPGKISNMAAERNLWRPR